MHNNYYFLRKLTPALEKKLVGTVISECFSQNKDELVVRFETASSPFFLKASLAPTISALSFPKEFHRARKNSVDLFDTIIGRRVLSIQQFLNERSFALQISNNISVLFKMHGNKSNILVYEDYQDPILFKTSLLADSNIRLSDLDRQIDWSLEHFNENKNNVQALYFTFGKPIWNYLRDQGFEELADEDKWKRIMQLKEKLENTDTFFISEWNKKISLLLFEAGSIKKLHESAIDAANDFFYTLTQAVQFDTLKQKAVGLLTTKIQSTRSYLNKTAEKLKEVESKNNYKVWADLLMANMHQIPPGAGKTLLENFYDNNHPIEIKLRKDQSPQKNAETFYRKAKNQQIELDKLSETLSTKQSEIQKLEAQLQKAQHAQSLHDLTEFSALSVKEGGKAEQPLPYHEFIVNGFKIWVGRNAEANDILTLKMSFKEDLWLHAKDVSGSHVLIKHQAGKVFPKDVIERAAELAAFNSKRKNDSLCPVIVTPKKYVRKRKGDPAGAVVVERESVLMVVPKLI